MPDNASQEWFKDWFNSPYYHLLYRHRDEHEAACFVERLVEELHLPKGTPVLDLACGRGRHSLKLQQLGYRVLGLDLSEKNISYARAAASPDLQFALGDMRKPFGSHLYGAVFNLFTSFGYFDSHADHQRTAANMYAALRKGGWLILDFLNVHRLLQGLVEQESKQVGQCTFTIKRTIERGKVIKHINVQDGTKAFHFKEKVQLLRQEDFVDLLEGAGFHITHFYGDFDLHAFDQQSSDRLVIRAQK